MVDKRGQVGGLKLKARWRPRRIDSEKYRDIKGRVNSYPDQEPQCLGFHLHRQLQAPCCQTDLQSSPTWDCSTMCKAVQDGEGPLH